MITIATLIILSPVILMAGLFSLFIILGICYSIISVLINLVKQVRKCQKQEDQQNIMKNTVKK